MENQDPKTAKLLKYFHPHYVGIVSAIFLFILCTIISLEVIENNHKTSYILKQDGVKQIEAISINSVNAIQALNEIEELFKQKLLTAAKTVDLIEQQQALSQILLARIAEVHGVWRINIYNKQREIIISSINPDSLFFCECDLSLLKLNSLFENSIQEKLIGFKMDNQKENSCCYKAVVRRKNGGVITASIRAKQFLQYQRSVSAKQLLRNVADLEDIKYIVIQNTDKVLLASESNFNFNSFKHDSFLAKAFEKDTVSTRFLKKNGTDIFEVVCPVMFFDNSKAFVRVGLKTEHFENATNRIMLQIILSSIIIGLIVIILMCFIKIRRNHRGISEAYTRIQKYSNDILERMNGAVVAINHDKRIKTFNRAAAELFKVSRENVINKPCQAVIPTDLSPFYHALERGIQVTDLEMPINLRNLRLTISISTSILWNVEGKIDSVFAVISDLTEKRSLEKTLRRKEKLTAMGQLASGVAHEIRNPLNSIAMISQRLDEEFEPQDDADEYYEIIRILADEVRQIEVIINQFLNFARPPKLNLSITNLNSLIDSTISLLSAELHKKNIEVKKNLIPMPPLLLDKDIMKQALLNIIKNGIDAIEEKGGKIKIWTDVVSERKILIGIEDSGKGMNPETISKIFNLYFTQKSKGTGLGLSIVHQNISQHNGRIEVESEVGKGSKFLLYLPRGWWKRK
jgi:PAS domain S-box-containing protein